MILALKWKYLLNWQGFGSGLNCEATEVELLDFAWQCPLFFPWLLWKEERMFQEF